MPANDLLPTLHGLVARHHDLLERLAQVKDSAQAARLMTDAAAAEGLRLDTRAVEQRLIAEQHGALGLISDEALALLAGPACRRSWHG
ncbi:hypothetical protein IMZ29_12470 [Achromobacter sp. GG226]|uniref:hypothetical protein n=1 Tax=Verticiella alkaliphila TaxID=2779529 RepID=UPI001C0C731F|nr:hypothetical protein [Verticiella sp. GG226]MBU4611315.1 hypothetical protein [Verticiella sp. GG226]